MHSSDVDLPTFLVRRGGFRFGVSSSLTGLSDKIRYWMLVMKIYVNAMGPVETIGTTGDLTGRRGLPQVSLISLRIDLLKARLRGVDSSC